MFRLIIPEHEIVHAAIQIKEHDDKNLHQNSLASLADSIIINSIRFHKTFPS